MVEWTQLTCRQVITADPSNYDALGKASRGAVDLGEFVPDAPAVPAEGNWNGAQRYLEDAVAAERELIVRHLDLGMSLRDRGNADGARAQFEWIARATVTDFKDPADKQQAAIERRKL